MKIQTAFNTSDKFSFHAVREDEVRQEILRLDGTKSTPVGDIPTGMLKSTIDIHASILTKIINLPLRNGCLPDDLNAAEVSPIFEKMMTQRRKNIGLSAFCLTCQRILKGSCILKLKVLWKKIYRNYLQDSEKIITPNTV